MGPGWYPDGQGNKRYWDGAWRNEVDNGLGGSRPDYGVPQQMPNPLERDGLKPPPIASRPSGPPAEAGAGAGIVGCLFLVAVAGIVLAQFLEIFRWPLLIGWVLLTIVGVVAFFNRDGNGGIGPVAAGVVVWLILGLGTLWGFDLAEDEPDSAEEIRSAREFLVEVAEGRSVSGTACAVMTEKAGQRLADRQGKPDCKAAVEAIASRLPDDIFERIDEIPMTTVGQSEDGYDRVRMGDNPFGWREIAIEPGLPIGEVAAVVPAAGR